jgi:hypothetical protein
MVAYAYQIIRKLIENKDKIKYLLLNEQMRRTEKE